LGSQEYRKVRAALEGSVRAALQRSPTQISFDRDSGSWRCASRNRGSIDGGGATEMARRPRLGAAWAFRSKSTY